ncbi:MAG: outer membrane beta-barrel protein, partial [Ruminococcaceae bacterium]|nr:outer membrane beta-barrel protein [Oscillospiraceae bacterium]
MKKISKIIIVLTIVVAVVSLSCISAFALDFPIVDYCSCKDYNSDGICDYCGSYTFCDCYDNNGDGKCEECGASVEVECEHADIDGDNICDLCQNYDFSVPTHNFEFSDNINGEKDIIYLGDFQNELSNIPVTSNSNLFVSINRLESYLSENSSLSPKFIEFQIVWFDDSNNYEVIVSDLVIERVNDAVFTITFNCGLRVHYEESSILTFGITSNITNNYTYTNYNSYKGNIGQYALLAVVYYSPYSPFISDDEIIVNKNLVTENETLKVENSILQGTNQNLTEQNNNLSAENSALHSTNQSLTEQNNNLSAENSALHSTNQN